jgi:predicted membrane-bound spermidine synthase
MAPSVRVVAALLFGSGFSALVYQTAWQRMFRLTFGASTAASAAVLAIFLGGLGLGGVLLGKRVERSPRPLAYYGNLELGITVLAVLSPFLSAGAHALYLAAGGSQALGQLGATLLRLVLTALVIGPAAVLMGGTLPAAARAVVSEHDASRRGLALLYSLNTIGAVLGALVGPLLLFGLLGNQLTLWGAACINGLVAITARAIGRSAAEVPVTIEPPNARAPAPAGSAASASPGTTQPAPPGFAAPAPARSEPAPAPLIYVAAALVGFVFLALELVWYRLLAPLMSGSSLTFGLILACALAGIGIGGYLFSRRSETQPATLTLLAATLGLEAVCVLIPFAWGDDLALTAAHLRAMHNLGFGYLLAAWTLVAALLVLPAAIVSGYQFPVIFSLLGQGRERVAQQVGRAYAFNTIGTLSGSLLAGFVLLPVLGATKLWWLLAYALALLGLACAVYAQRQGASVRRIALPVLFAGAALALGAAPGPGRVFRHTPVGAGRVELADKSVNQVIAWRLGAEDGIVWERDGVESSVAIDAANGIAFIVNGKSDGSIVGDGATQAFLGLLPAALHGRAKTAFVVGLGTGMTAGLLARVPGVERVEVAELEPAVREVARRAAPVNGRVLDNPKVHILNGDGRELLLTSSRKFDLIISEPSNPYRAGVASLFTREYYEAAASRLERGGLFVQWLQGYEADAITIAITIHTLRQVFPRLSLWGPQGHDLVLVASFEPQIIDADRLRRDLAHPAYANWMRRTWSMEDAEGFVAHFLAPHAVLDTLANSLAPAVNTDDLNVLEFAYGRSVGDGRYSVTDDLFAALKAYEYRPEVRGTLNWERVEDLRHRIGWAGYRGPEPSEKTRAVIEGCRGSMKRAKPLWPEGVEPEDMVEVWVRGWLAAMDGDASAELALSLADRLEGAGFAAEGALVRARLAEQRKDLHAAVDLTIQAYTELRRTALPLCDAAGRALERGVWLAERAPERAPDLLRALAQGPFAVTREERERRAAQNAIGMRSGDPKLCLAGLGPLRERPTWSLVALELRADCLRRAGAPDAARAAADLREFLSNEPNSFQRARGIQYDEDGRSSAD